jgi:hypothetical protein
VELIDAPPLAGYPEPYGLLCAILQDGTNEWRGEMDQDLPAEAMVWQAYPGGHSIGGCILHNVAVEVFWFEQYVLDRVFDPEEKRLLQWDETDVDAWRWAVPHHEPLSWYFALQDRFRARILESVVRRWKGAHAEVGVRARDPARGVPRGPGGAVAASVAGSQRLVFDRNDLNWLCLAF